MELCCTSEFKEEVATLRKNGSYADIEAVIADFYCGCAFEQANTGDVLQAMPGMTYIKKRLSGRGGYRVYLLAVVKGEKVYLGFVHPKTGGFGAENVTLEKRKEILREIIQAVKAQQLYRIERDSVNSKRLKFEEYVTV